MDDTEGGTPTGLEDLRICRRGFGEFYGERVHRFGNAYAHQRIAQFFGCRPRGVYLTEVLREDGARALYDTRTYVGICGLVTVSN